MRRPPAAQPADAAGLRFIVAGRAWKGRLGRQDPVCENLVAPSDAPRIGSAGPKQVEARLIDPWWQPGAPSSRGVGGARSIEQLALLQQNPAQAGVIDVLDWN